MTTCTSAVHAASTEDPVLRAAAELFYARGISAVSVQDIRARAGASLKAVYARYPSKDALVVAYLRLTHEACMRDLRQAVSGADEPTGEARLRAVFRWLEDWFSAPDFAGCGIANTRGQRLGEAAAQVVTEHVAELQELCREVTGEDEAARMLFVLIEGAIATAAATRDPGAARIAGAMALQVIPGLTPRCAPGGRRTPAG